MPEINEKIIARLKAVVKGERFAYHHGNLAHDRAFSYEVHATASLVWEAYLTGRFCLFQRRIPNDAGFVYYIARI